MKYMKMLGPVAIAVTAVMAFVGAGTASAAGVLCSTQTAPCGSKWANGTTLTLSEASSILLKETGEKGPTLDTCEGSAVSDSFTNGSSSSNAHGPIASLTWSGCTFTTTTILNGGLEIISAGSHNGTVKSSAEIKVTISTSIFGSCVYGVPSNTTLGTVTEGNPAAFDALAVVTRRPGSNLACPDTANWSGSYTQVAPDNTTLSVEAS